METTVSSGDPSLTPSGRELPEAQLDALSIVVNGRPSEARKEKVLLGVPGC